MKLFDGGSSSDVKKFVFLLKRGSICKTDDGKAAQVLSHVDSKTCHLFDATLAESSGMKQSVLDYGILKCL